MHWWEFPIVIGYTYTTNAGTKFCVRDVHGRGRNRVVEFDDQAQHRRRSFRIRKFRQILNQEVPAEKPNGS